MSDNNFQITCAAGGISSWASRVEMKIRRFSKAEYWREVSGFWRHLIGVAVERFGEGEANMPSPSNPHASPAEGLLLSATKEIKKATRG